MALARKLDPEAWNDDLTVNHSITVHSPGRALVQFGMRDIDFLERTNPKMLEQLTAIMRVIQNGRVRPGDGSTAKVIDHDDTLAMIEASDG